jgi:8-oxo-dGTP pyrophosphatase MutT (NUDIX family)
MSESDLWTFADVFERELDLFEGQEKEEKQTGKTVAVEKGRDPKVSQSEPGNQAQKESRTAEQSPNPTEARLQRLFARAHGLAGTNGRAGGLSALCLSGGGIRSAAICLGVLQVLQERKALGKFNYLSLVSGGGFTGGWITGRRGRPEGNAKQPTEKEEESAVLDRQLAEALGPDGVREFHRNRRYLAPGFRLADPEFWKLVWDYLKGAILNLVAVASLIIAALATVRVSLIPIWDGSRWAWLAPFAAVMVIAVLWRIIPPLERLRPTILRRQAITSRPRNTDPSERATDLWFVKALVGALMFYLAAGIVKWGPDFLSLFASRIAIVGGSSALSLALITNIATGPAPPWWWKRLRRITAPLLGFLAVASFFLSLAWVHAKLYEIGSISGIPEWVWVPLTFLAAGLSVSLLCGANKTSLHGMYAERLNEAFTKDRNVTMDELLHIAQNKRLFPVINAAVNVSPSRKARKKGVEDRNAYPATLTPYHFGFDHPQFPGVGGYVNVAEVTGLDGKMDLSGAMAISGAAFGSAMGFYGSTLSAFALTVLNLRLGLWLDNPVRIQYRDDGGGHLQRLKKRWHKGPEALFRELIGWHDAQAAAVNVSDGGHFDNLGLYCMLRRRCRSILVVDGSGDRRDELTELSRAIRLARVDLGIPVTVNGLDLSESGRPAATGIYKGTIDYRRIDGPEAANGVLVYIRPEVRKDSPLDVRSYAQRHPRFPRESTADQSFSEEQFESYRALGQHTAARTLAIYELDKAMILGQDYRTALEDPHRLVEAMAESAIRQKRSGMPTHAGVIAYKGSGDNVQFLVVQSRVERIWVFPKGEIEAGESLKKAALREFIEETNLEPRKVNGADLREDGPEDRIVPGFVHSFGADGGQARVAYYFLDWNKEESRYYDKLARVPGVEGSGSAAPGIERRDRQWVRPMPRQESQRTGRSENELVKQKLEPFNEQIDIQKVSRIPRFLIDLANRAKDAMPRDRE